MVSLWINDSNLTEITKGFVEDSTGFVFKDMLIFRSRFIATKCESTISFSCCHQILVASHTFWVGSWDFCEEQSCENEIDLKEGYPISGISGGMV